MTVAVIVQASSKDSQNPDLLLEPLGERSALARCLARAQRIPGADAVICAVPDSPAGERLSRDAQAAGALIAHGPRDDRLAQCANAARSVQADIVLLLSAHAPMIDPTIAGGVLAMLRESRADYASNTMPALFPHGLDCEAFSAGLLSQAERDGGDPALRADPSGWIRRRPELTCANFTGPGGGLERLRWVLEGDEDLAFARAVFAELGERAGEITASELAALCLRRPDLVAINATLADEDRLAATDQASLVSRPMRFFLAA